MTLASGTQLGPYKILSPLGAGGMGTIYEATQEKPRRTVALKLMKHSIASRSAMRRFEYESQILARLNHPGIAQVYATGEEDGTPFYAMELVEEPSLNLVIRQIRDASRGMLKLKSAGMKWASASVILIRGSRAIFVPTCPRLRAWACHPSASPNLSCRYS